MELSVKSMLLLSVLTTILMIVVSSIIYLTEREKKYIAPLEFWISYGVYFMLAFLLEGYSPKVFAIACVAWIWRIRAIRLILEDITGVILYRPWHRVFIFSSYTLACLFALMDTSFFIYTLPAGLSIFLLGHYYIYQSFLVFRKKTVSSVHYLLLLTLVIIFIHTLNYSYLRLNTDFAAIGFGIALLTTILMAVMIPTVTIYELQRTQSNDLEKMVDERSQQLVIQSKMSALGEMAAGVAHEINNPLGVITGRAFQLRREISIKEDVDAQRIESSLDQIEQTAEKISKTIKSLRHFARDSRQDSPRKTQLQDIVNETMGLCRERFKHAGIDVIVEDVPNIFLDCRSVQISQVLLSILNNSFDALLKLKDRWVKISFEETSEGIAINIVDSGQGIPQVLRSRLMQPFFTTKTDSKRTGLGLSISKEIIVSHRGRFYYDDKSANTKFVIFLPRVV
jgi:signal transduction histidine kinase